MSPCRLILSAMCVSLVPVLAHAQQQEAPLQVFGYFQNVFQVERYENGPDNTTFAAQQLNLFFQKDLAPRFSAFVNFEFLNNFSSSENWGAANMKEAWVRYEWTPALKVRFGLQTPVFNHLNEIKTRTPLLPYIVRPIVYETSLEDVITQDEYVPERGYLQVYGAKPLGGRLTLDYAVYAGNSPNIRVDRTQGQTGVDTTLNVMTGGRIGLRLDDVKVGFSLVADRVNAYRTIGRRLTDDPKLLEEIAKEYTLVPRTRYGVDFSAYFGRFYLEGEWISASLHPGGDLLDIERAFYYGTLGWIPGDRLELYASYWWTREWGVVQDNAIRPTVSSAEWVHLKIPTVGAKWTLNPRVVLKAQTAYAMVRFEDEVRVSGGFVGPTLTREDQTFVMIALGVSVFF